MFNFLKTKFTRYQCTDCKKYFWHTAELNLRDSAKKCGDCSPKEDYQKYLTYSLTPQTRTEFKNSYLQHFKSTNVKQGGGYQEVPCRQVRLSRGNIRYVNAGICIYTPHFLKGFVVPPYSERLISYQNCIRFLDYAEVGKTSRHLTNFIMYGQHVFETDKNRFTQTWVEENFNLLFSFFEKYFSTDLKLYKIHESQWTDKINKGVSLEIYIGGVQVCNQVYTTHDVSDNPLRYRYVDMGLGELRCIQILNKKDSVYEVLEYPLGKEILYDHLTTIKLCDDSGIYFSKKNVGYNLRVIAQRLFLTYAIDQISSVAKSLKFNELQISSLNKEYQIYLKANDSKQTNRL